MSREAVMQAKTLIESNPDRGEHGGGQADRLIDEAENYLGNKFPPSYRLFLSELGDAAFGPCEYYGIVGEDFERPGPPNGIWYTKQMRDRGSLSDDMIAVSDSGDGGTFCIDCSRRDPETGECPVILVWPGYPPTEPEEVAPDFGTFLLNEITSVLSSEGGD